MAQILRDFGVPAHPETRGNIADLVTKFEQGRGIIIGVNAGLLWGDRRHLGTGGPNHAVVLTGVVRDADAGTIRGFYINDSGNRDERGNARSGQFISLETIRKAWEKMGGTSVVTDKTHPW
jgi:hypothetical protein